MNGTEKQIKWAEDIKANWENQINYEIETAKRRSETGSMPEHWYGIVVECAGKIKEKIDSVEKASIVIDQRKTDCGNMVLAMAADIYRKTI